MSFLPLASIPIALLLNSLRMLPMAAMVMVMATMLHNELLPSNGHKAGLPTRHRGSKMMQQQTIMMMLILMLQ